MIDITIKFASKIKNEPFKGTGQLLFLVPDLSKIKWKLEIETVRVLTIAFVKTVLKNITFCNCCLLIEYK